MSGTQFHIPNCSNVTFDQLLHANLIRGISGIACFLISVILLFSLLFLFRAYKNTLQRLILYYAITITIYQAFNVSLLEHQFQYKGQDTVCAVLGGCVYYIVSVTVILSAFIVNYSTYLVLRAMELCTCGRTFNVQRNCSKGITECIFILFALIIPLLYSLAPLTDHHYGISGPYCGIKTTDEDCNPVYQDLIIFFAVGEFIELEMLVVVIVTLIVYCRIRRRVPIRSMDMLVQKTCFLSVLYSMLVVVNTIMLVMTPLMTLKDDPVSYFRHQIANAFGFPLFFEFTLVIMFAVSARISKRGFVCSCIRSSRKAAVVDGNTDDNKTTPPSCPLFQPSETCYIPSYTGNFTQVSVARSETDPLLNGEITPQIYSERIIS